MRHILLGAVALTALCSSAVAADLPVYTKAPVVVAPVFNWSGFYVGGFVGGAVADGNANSTEPRGAAPAAPFAPVFYNATAFDNNYSLSNTFIGGGTIGLNYQPSASNWLFGVEGEVGYLKLSRSVVDINPVPAGAPGADSIDRTRIGDLYGVFAARLGYAFDRVLFYAKGGAAFVGKEASFTDKCAVAPCSVNTLNTDYSGTQLTWAAGGGLEYAINDSWSVKGEYLYLATKETYTYSANASNNQPYTVSHTDPGVHTGKIGLNYRWGGPAVGRY
uniref:Porin n=1 Tax=Rhodopseudomonas palustris (strain BisA53) TaxID=316055 RepID=Q07TE4_RHOP5